MDPPVNVAAHDATGVKPTDFARVRDYVMSLSSLDCESVSWLPEVAIDIESDDSSGVFSLSDYHQATAHFQSMRNAREGGQVDEQVGPDEGQGGGDPQATPDDASMSRDVEVRPASPASLFHYSPSSDDDGSVDDGSVPREECWRL